MQKTRDSDPQSIAESIQDCLTIPQAAKIFNTHPATCWRWATDGVRGVILRTVFRGGRRVVPRDAIEEFLAFLNPQLAAAKKAKASQRRSREAGKALEAIGC